jgi:4a-hydroxytetrahydrobiopterin dehydratase
MPDKLSEQAIKVKLQSLNGWEFKSNSIVKSFKTSSFPATMGFVTAVGGVSQKLNHHPDYILMKYKEVEISFSTHSSGGVTEKDIEIAEEINKITF